MYRNCQVSQHYMANRILPTASAETTKSLVLFLVSQIRSLITVLCWFQTAFMKDLPLKDSVTHLYDNLVNKGCFCEDRSSDHP